ncbi:hypothetical protein ZWY2020_028217 [Hordeum vulgare]|nr:hypothetical protein ZWY2020_028217 [Hordeum vulgare]
MMQNGRINVPPPDCFCFHVWNAWEETIFTGDCPDTVVIICSCMTPPDALFSEATADDALVNLRATLTVIRLDLRAGVSRRHHLASGLNLEVDLGLARPSRCTSSELVVLDAVTMEAVTMVALPFRVPYGFGGAFLTRDQLAT